MTFQERWQRRQTMAPTKSAKRPPFLSETELCTARKANFHSIVADGPGHSQNEFHIASLQENTPNTNSLQRDPKRPKILVNLEDYNTLIKKLAEQRTASFLQYSCNLWKTECERLKKELSAAMVNQECDQALRSADITPSKSSSRTSKFWKQVNKNSRPDDQERSKIKMIDADIPVKLSSRNLSHFDDCLRYANSFVFETCDGRWHEYSAICDWVPNESTLVQNLVRDWRGQYHKKTWFCKTPFKHWVVS